MPSTMTALKAAAILAFPVAHAQNVFASYEGYSEECTSCYSNKLTRAHSPIHVQGGNPLTTVCAAGNDQLFRPCDQLCIDKDGHSFRQNKCMGSSQGTNKRDTSCGICWKSASLENGCLTPFVIAGNEHQLAQCLCQPGNIDAFRQKCDISCATGGMSPTSACSMVGLGKRDESIPSTLTTTTTVTASPQSTLCNSTTSAVVAPVTTTGMPCPSGYKSCYTTAEGGSCILPYMACPGAPNPLGPTSSPVIGTNSTVPFASGTGSVGTSTTNTSGSAPTESAPISNGAPALGNFGLAAFGVVATLFFAFA